MAIEHTCDNLRELEVIISACICLGLPFKADNRDGAARLTWYITLPITEDEQTGKEKELSE